MREFVFQLTSDAIHHCPCVCGYQLYPCPPPHSLGNSGDLVGTYPGIYRILCPCRPGTYPGLTRGDISFNGAGNLLPWSIYAGPLIKGARDLPGGLQEICPPQSQAVPGGVPWTSQSTKLNPLASPRVVGARVTIDRRIISI